MQTEKKRNILYSAAHYVHCVMLLSSALMELFHFAWSLLLLTMKKSTMDFFKHTAGHTVNE